MIKGIEKRDGTIVPFDQEKITQAIFKAEKAIAEGEKKETDYSVAQRVSDRVVGKLEAVIANGVRPKVELIQDLVEKQLMDDGYSDAAKAYILYREQHKRIRGLLFDSVKAIDEYLGGEDWEIKENSNMTYSLQGLNVKLTSKAIANYWLSGIYPKEIAEAHKNGDFHIHDLGTFGPYCVGWDLEDLLREGFRGVRGKIESRPAKHFDVALMHTINFLYTLQGEAAGAQAFSNFDTYLAPFIRYDKMDYAEIKQCMQKFCNNMNVSTRVGFQTPFTNITLDLKVPSYLKDTPVIIGGKMKNETYGDFQEEMDMFNRAFAECMIEGEARERVFTFPIPTYNITKDFDWDNPAYDMIWEMTAKYGIPYFSNFVNSDMKPEDARSMCCRLRLDQTELRRRGGGLFGSNPLTGSIGVVTINIPRLGYTSSNEKEFFGKLERLIELSSNSLEIKRKALERNMELYPYSKFYLRDVHQRFGEYWKNHFSTIGLLGMNEGIINFMLGENITTERGRGFALKVLDFMKEKTRELQEKTGDMYNLEATPGEGATYSLAMKDKEAFPDIIVANEDAIRCGAKPFYTNSTHLPVNYTSDLFEALELQDPLQVMYTGGTVLHGFLGERISAEGAKKLVRTIPKKYHLPYFTITPTFSICQNHGYIRGEKEKCPECGETCEVWSRSVGYLRPVEQWNDGKQSEWNERKMFKVV
jgi:anaerobic ribonucleoside-triphosphate reductase